MKSSDHREFQENLPAYLCVRGSRSKAIYIVCMCLVAGMLISLPLVRIPVSVTGQGIIRPEDERAEIIPPVSGVVEEVMVREGLTLTKSSPILKIRSWEPAGNLEGDMEILREVQVFIQDIAGLLSVPVIHPESRRYSREYETYKGRQEYLDMLYKKADRECERHKGLFENKLISEKQYDDLCFERNKALAELAGYRSESLRQWQESYNECLQRKRVLENRIRQSRERIHLTTVYSPVKGNLVEMKGIYPGSSVSAGEVIGIISPDARLIGEFYIKPRDIAFVHEGQFVRLNMHSFPAREWGMPRGSIYEISDDFLILDQQAAYRVKCRLDMTGLHLKNGIAGQLKKGMTFQAHCLVVNRTLLQLLWDKTDKWLNPLAYAPD